jgi:hypothetical protein
MENKYNLTNEELHEMLCDFYFMPKISGGCCTKDYMN